MSRREGYPENKAVETWEENGVRFSIVKVDSYRMGHYCGYARLPGPVLPQTIHDRVEYMIPVHGGITYGEHSKDGTVVYGFDCAHAGDEERPETRDMEWLKDECRRMARGLEIIGEYTRRIQLAETWSDQEKIMEEIEQRVCGRGCDCE